MTSEVARALTKMLPGDGEAWFAGWPIANAGWVTSRRRVISSSSSITSMALDASGNLIVVGQIVIGTNQYEAAPVNAQRIA
jgi:hypothetical protein